MTTVQERLGQIRGEMQAAVELGNAVWLDDLRREQYALWQREQDDAHDREAIVAARATPDADARHGR